jgi:ATP-dependent HslUV protease subunit HslV
MKKGSNTTNLNKNSMKHSNQPDEMQRTRSTTIIAVKRDGLVALAGDGQVTVGQTVLKHGARKVRRLYQNRVIAGFAGSVADAQALSDRFESKLEGSSGNITRAAIEFAKDWRTDRVLRRLEAMMIVTDGEHLYILSGDGNIVEPDDGIAAIGSGGPFAAAAAKALVKNTTMSAREIVEDAMRVAAEICIYTNDKVTVDQLP